MALFQVNADGHAPSYAKPGDYIATGGGTYQILDSKLYSRMDDGQLASIGVGYNPANKFYSKRISDQSSPYYTGVGSDGRNYSTLSQRLAGVESWNPKTYDTAEKLRDQYIKQQLGMLEMEYNNSLSGLKRTFNRNYAMGERQKNKARDDARKNRDQLYEDAYYNNKVASQMASNRGLTSSAQGLAMSVSTLAQAASKASQLTSDRDKLIHDIDIEMNRLSADYDIDKDTLRRNFGASKMKAMSTAELQFLQASLQVDDYNADLWNKLTMNKYTMDRQSAESEKDRQFRAGESQKDRDFQKMMTEMQIAASRRNGGGKEDTGSGNEIQLLKAATLYDEYKQKIEESPSLKRQAELLLYGVEKGMNSYDEFNQWVYRNFNHDAAMKAKASKNKGGFLDWFLKSGGPSVFDVSRSAGGKGSNSSWR